MLTMLTASSTFRLLTIVPPQQYFLEIYNDLTNKHPPYVKHVSNTLDNALVDRSG